MCRRRAAAAAMSPPFAALRRKAGAPIGQGRIPARQALVAEAVLEDWAKG